MELNINWYEMPKGYDLTKHSNIICERIRITEDTWETARDRTKREHDNIIIYLKKLHSLGIIKSIWIPKNKKYTKELNELVTAKRQMKRNLINLKEFFE